MTIYSNCIHFSGEFSEFLLLCIYFNDDHVATVHSSFSGQICKKEKKRTSINVHVAANILHLLGLRSSNG